MRGVSLLLLVALAACSESQVNRVAIDERTFKIESPAFGSGAVGPNRRAAEEKCPKGYRVLSEERHKEDASNGVVTTWIIRCL